MQIDTSAKYRGNVSVTRSNFQDRSPLETLTKKSFVEYLDPSAGLSLTPPRRDHLFASNGTPESPLLHSNFRSSTVTSVNSIDPDESHATGYFDYQGGNGNVESPMEQQFVVDGEIPPPSPSSVYTRDSYAPPEVVHSPPTPPPEERFSSDATRSTLQVPAIQRNFSRPQIQRTAESEEAKQQVLNRVKSAKQLRPAMSPSSSTSTYSPLSARSNSFPRSPMAPPTPSPSLSQSRIALMNAALSPSPSSNSLSSPPYPDYSAYSPPSPSPQMSHSASYTLTTSPSTPNPYPSPPSSLESTSSSHLHPDYPPTPPSSQLSPSRSFRNTPTTDTGQQRSLKPPRHTPSLHPSHSYSPVSPTPTPSKSPAVSHRPRTPGSSSPSPTPGPKTANDFLMLGIETHLLTSPTSLPLSAQYFEKAATLNGGCGMGMLMWGLSLRHGWGVEKDEKRAFSWLRRACEIALGDLESFNKAEKVKKKGAGEEIKTELVMAIYEVGQSFFQGWGVARDRTMAVNYFTLAARLGDMDAQQDLGFCYANGKGCKKDKKEAARWYRAAAAQGASTVGLAWIFKEKYS